MARVPVSLHAAAGSEVGAPGLEPETVGLKGQQPRSISAEDKGTCESDGGALSPLLSPDAANAAVSDPLALAQALLTQAETAPDPAPLIAAAKALVQAAQADKDGKPRLTDEGAA